MTPNKGEAIVNKELKPGNGYDPSKYYVYDKRDKSCDWCLHIPIDQAWELVNHDKHYYLLD